MASSTATTTATGSNKPSAITIPEPETEDAPVAGPSKPAAPQVRQDRLYVGNLHPTIDEYTLIKAFSRFGKITSLDYLFHKAGPQKGKPRGYAFVEYASKDEALKAMITMHDKLVRGRNLVVTFAHQAPPLDDSYGKSFKRRTDTSRPTALSLLKSQGKLKTGDKIAALERKLAQLHPPSPSSPPSTPSSSTALPPPPTHALPPKPPAVPSSGTPVPVPPRPSPSAGAGVGVDPGPGLGEGKNVRRLRLKDDPPDLRTLMELRKKEGLKRLGHRPNGVGVGK